MVILSTLLGSAGEMSSCFRGSIFTSYLLFVSELDLIADLNFGLGNEEGKDMLLFRDFRRLLVRDL